MQPSLENLTLANFRGSENRFVK
uniref:Uncharacterized protein n=1 Tax=Rhizophora mucronata TaxID=61149 RepID=A0A2P2NLT9_RHIMU